MVKESTKNSAACNCVNHQISMIVKAIRKLMLQAEAIRLTRVVELEDNNYCIDNEAEKNYHYILDVKLP